MTPTCAEFRQPDGVEASDAYKSAASSADELRLWKLYRAWDNDADKDS